MTINKRPLFKINNYRTRCIDPIRVFIFVLFHTFTETHGMSNLQSAAHMEDVKDLERLWDKYFR